LKTRSNKKDAIIDLSRHPTFSNIQCSSALPCCRRICWPAFL